MPARPAISPTLTSTPVRSIGVAETADVHEDCGPASTLPGGTAGGTVGAGGTAAGESVVEIGRLTDVVTVAAGASEDEASDVSDELPHPATTATTPTAPHTPPDMPSPDCASYSTPLVVSIPRQATPRPWRADSVPRRALAGERG